MRETEHRPGGPSYGAVFFEPVPDAALVLGLDLGARFPRGAVCDLVGDIRARQDVELGGADAEAALDAIDVGHVVADRGTAAGARAGSTARSSACPASSTPRGDSA